MKNAQNRIRNRLYQPGFRGSFTVEAAMLMPVIILLLAWLIRLSIGLYEATDAAAAAIGPLRDLDSLQSFRRVMLAKETIQQLLGAS